MITIAKALESLNLQSKWVVRGNNYEGIEWQSNDIEKPTKEKVEEEIAKLQAEYDAKEYARKRVTEYPSIPDQLDTLYHSGLDAWKAQIKTVKDKYPKV